MWNRIRKYKSKIKGQEIWTFVTGSMHRLGQKAVYSLLLLYYAFKNGDTPAWAKNIIIGVIGYVLSPIDSIPDLTPLIGFTDDLGVLAFGLVNIACYIDTEVRQKAVLQMGKWFKGSIDEDLIAEVDRSL